MKKILIIDDDQDLSEVIKAVVEHAGFEAILTNDSKTGISKAQDLKPDLILLDIMMPGMGGPEVLKILKCDDATKEIPIIFLSGLVSDSDKEAGVAGVNIDGIEYQSIAKPFDNTELVLIIKETLK